jgi:3-dehydroquinate synthase
VLPRGERHKVLHTCEDLWGTWYEHSLDRKALVVAIGGGVTTDLAAFAASTWKRGIAFALMPTTLLAMVDAAIGGKTGVDFRSGKNLLGSFARPEALLLAPSLLRTLPIRELRCGLAEMLKHGLLFDEVHWRELTRLDLVSAIDWLPLIRRSIALKTAIVEADPLEQGPRQLLNLGHTLGHAIESALLGTSTELLHGEAVAVGIHLEAQLAIQHVGLATEVAAEIEEVLRRLGYKLALPPMEATRLKTFLRQDKKNTQHAAGSVELRMVLLERMCQARYGVAVPESDALEVIAGQVPVSR